MVHQLYPRKAVKSGVGGTQHIKKKYPGDSNEQPESRTQQRRPKAMSIPPWPPWHRARAFTHPSKPQAPLLLSEGIGIPGIIDHRSRGCPFNEHLLCQGLSFSRSNSLISESL